MCKQRKKNYILAAAVCLLCVADLCEVSRGADIESHNSIVTKKDVIEFGPYDEVVMLVRDLYNRLFFIVKNKKRDEALGFSVVSSYGEVVFHIPYVQEALVWRSIYSFLNSNVLGWRRLNRVEGVEFLGGHLTVKDTSRRYFFCGSGQQRYLQLNRRGVVSEYFVYRVLSDKIEQPMYGECYGNTFSSPVLRNGTIELYSLGTEGFVVSCGSFVVHSSALRDGYVPESLRIVDARPLWSRESQADREARGDFDLFIQDVDSFLLNVSGGIK